MYLIVLVGEFIRTWGNASNWANAAASSGYTVNNTPKVGAIMQTTQGYYGNIVLTLKALTATVVFSVSEMNYGHGAGVVTSRTISANQAGLI